VKAAKLLLLDFNNKGNNFLASQHIKNNYNNNKGYLLNVVANEIKIDTRLYAKK
jgi:hypothetical protein